MEQVAESTGFDSKASHSYVMIKISKWVPIQEKVASQDSTI
jgi:hypothetical protein